MPSHDDGLIRRNPLARIDGEAYHAPGLAFSGRAWPDPYPGQFSLLCHGAAGAVELLCYTPNPGLVTTRGPGGLFGSLETHSPRMRYPRYRAAPEVPDTDHCWALSGPCWTSGNVEVFDPEFAPLIADGAACPLLTRLAAYYRAEFPNEPTPHPSSTG
jgi:hypothetical protein